MRSFVFNSLAGSFDLISEVTINATPNGLSVDANQVITLQAASAGSTGALTSADWSTFNGKEPAISAGTTSQYWRGDKSFQTLDTNAILPHNTQGAPDITTLYEQMDHFLSAGTTSGALITDNGNGTVNISASTTYLRTSQAVSSITRVSSTATVTTSTNHGYNSGEYVHIRGANESAYNGFYFITVTGLNTFTYQVSGSPATPATGTIFSINDHNPLYLVEVPATTNLALTDHATNYIFISFDGNTPTYGVTTSGNSGVFVGLARTLIFTVAREGNTLWITDNRDYVVDSVNKINTLHRNRMTYEHTLGGSVLTGVGTRNIALTAGTFWSGVNQIDHAAFDTSASSTFTTTYTSDNGTTWTYTAGQTQIDNSQYNAIGSGLTALTAGNYGVHWVYVMNNNPSTLMVVYGQSDYSKSGAFNAQVPTVIPNIVAGIGSLVGKIIIQQGASSFTAVISAFVEEFINPSPTLDSLADVNVPSPTLNDMLTWNGAQWVATAGTTVSAGNGVNFYNATPTVAATGTNNANFLASLSRTPVTTAEQTIATAVNNTTLFNSAWTFGTALGLTSLPAGTWTFTIYAGVSNAGTRNITKNIYQVVPSSTAGTTITTTSTGTSRTATASGGTPFVSGDASGTITVGGYLQTPQGLYKITAFTSSTVVTIAVPSTYVNESAVAFRTWKNLFGGTSPNITATSPAYAPLTFYSTQGAFSIAATDTLGTILFVTSNNNTTITTVYNGTTHNSFANTPLTILHDDLVGLQGGTGSGVTGEYYHLTANEYAGTGVGTGNMARLTSPVFTTPNIGNATGNVSGTAANVTGVVAVANGGTNVSSLTAHNVLTGGSAGTSVGSVAPGALGNVLTSDGTDWTSAVPASGPAPLLQTTPSTYVATLLAGEAISIRDAVCLDLDNDGVYKVFRSDSRNPNRYRSHCGFATAAATATPHIQTLTLSAALVASNVVNMNINGRAMASVTYASSSDATWQAVATALAPAHVQTFTLGGALVASNVIAYKINGTAFTTTYASSSDATLQAIATQIATHGDVASAVVTVVGGNQTGTDDRVITITGNTAKEVRFTEVGITGGVSQTSITMATTTQWSPDILSAVVTVVGGNQTGTDDRVITLTGQGGIPINITGAAVTGGASQATISLSTTQSPTGQSVSINRDGPLGGFSGLTNGALYYVYETVGKVTTTPTDTLPEAVCQAIGTDTLWSFPKTRPFATPTIFVRSHGNSAGGSATNTAQLDVEMFNFTTWSAGTADTLARWGQTIGDSCLGPNHLSIDGVDSTGTLQNATHAFNKTTWSAPAARTTARYGSAGAQMGGAFYIAKGFVAGTPSAQMDSWNGSTWSNAAATLANASGTPGCFYQGGKVRWLSGAASGSGQTYHDTFNGVSTGTDTAYPVGPATTAHSSSSGTSAGAGIAGRDSNGGSYQWNGSWSASIAVGRGVDYKNAVTDNSIGAASGYIQSQATCYINGGSSNTTTSVNTTNSFNGVSWSSGIASSSSRASACGAGF